VGSRAAPQAPRIGDGTTYRWWLREIDKLGYRHKVLYLNSMFFGVPQSRDRIYIASGTRSAPDPDLDHRPWRGARTATRSSRPCGRLEDRRPADSGRSATASSTTTGARAAAPRSSRRRHRRCHCARPERTSARASATASGRSRRRRWHEPSAADSGSPSSRRCSCRRSRRTASSASVAADGHPDVAAGDRARVDRRADRVTAGNTFERAGSECRTRTSPSRCGRRPPPRRSARSHGPRRGGSPTRGTHARCRPSRLPTQGSAPSRSPCSPSGVVPYRQHTLPTSHSRGHADLHLRPAPRCSAPPACSSDEAAAASRGAVPTAPPAEPSPGINGASPTQCCSAAFFKQNGGPGTDTAPHPLNDPLGTLTSKDTTGLAIADWHRMLDGHHRGGLLLPG
jgi:DNA (cytosine-5)-methyltransferase 1